MKHKFYENISWPADYYEDFTVVREADIKDAKMSLLSASVDCCLEPDSESVRGDVAMAVEAAWGRCVRVGVGKGAVADDCAAAAAMASVFCSRRRLSRSLCLVNLERARALLLSLPFTISSNLDLRISRANRRFCCKLRLTWHCRKSSTPQK
jgi:hypothetical protein